MAWHSKPVAQKTLPNFKTHFKAAQKETTKSQQAVTTDSLGHHNQANGATLVDKLFQGLSSQRNTNAAEQLAEQQQMQQRTNQLVNSTQQNQSMLDHKCSRLLQPSPSSKPSR
jgi:hypothetical protein